MYRDAQNKLVYSPSDLVRFMESPFASWMERVRVERPEAAIRDEPSEELKLIASTGNAHEAAFLQNLKKAGRDVCEVPDDASAAEVTRHAMANGREIIFQGYLTMPPFAGYSDFLVRTKHSGGLYEVWDTKLARKVKPYFLIQLSCYAEMLELLQGQRPEHICVVLGTNEVKRFRTDDYFYYYQQLKSAFLAQMEHFSVDANPPHPHPRADHGLWQSHADRLLVDSDHLIQVAGITIGQVRKLNDAGISTVEELSELQDRVPRLVDDIRIRLVNQAQMQMETRQRELAATVGEPVTPAWRILPADPSIPHNGLSMLPPPSAGDVYFDIEGYPLSEGGLEYLLGAVVLEDDEPQFYDWWAHNHTDEKRSFEQFIDWVYARWQNDSGMHIYHYAAYEVTAMKRLMGRYGTREDEVDNLLRNQVFVDLYRIVRQGLLIGGPNYSLKTVEKLYQDSRAGDVQTAAASMVYYAWWLESGEPPHWQESKLLKDIRDYNEVDCVSTWRLAEWLREQQEVSEMHWQPPVALQGRIAANREQQLPRTTDTVLREEDLQRRNLSFQMLAEIPDDQTERAADTHHWQLQEMLAHLLEFHRREAKPVWWAMYDRLSKTEEELIEDVDCLGGLQRTADPPVPIKRSTGFWYSFNPTQETKLAQGDQPLLAHYRNVKAGIEQVSGEGRILLKAGAAALSQVPNGTLPERVSLIPMEHVPPGEIPGAIQRIAEGWHERQQMPEALRRFLLRLPPLVTKATPGEALLRDDECTVDGCIRLARNMETSTLCIQGPPGSGKTFTASHMITALLRDGKNVGIASNSHKAVLNVMKACCETGDRHLKAIKAGGDSKDPLFEKYEHIRYIGSNPQAAASYEGGLIGGSAWLFSNPDMAGRLDYLFIDEAGQVPIANLTGMSAATQNIILIGDQMQLRQPIQGSHPGHSGESLLEYLLQDHAIVPAHLGVFLAETWRLHPDICDFISGSVYEGSLRAHADTANRTIEVPMRPDLIEVDSGLVFSPVEHVGNTQSSAEEVERIVHITDDLLGRMHADRNGQNRRSLTIEDILYVSPYNRQVRLLKDSLPSDARVASVDKFQGQEAPVVIVSLCCSAGEFGSRGVDFVLNRNRLNVAISRAQSLAIVVGDPAIGSSTAGNLREMQCINLFCRIVQDSRQ